MLDKVTELLEALGYTLQDGDETILSFCVDKVTSIIKNDVNWKDIPEGLEQVAADMILGEFLKTKKTFAPDSLASLDLGPGIKQIQEGDKNTTFSTGESTLTDEQRLDAYIAYLLSSGRDEFSSFRRIRW